MYIKVHVYNCVYQNAQRGRYKRGDMKDVAIVGGGLAGGLLSVALAHAGFSCIVIDAAPPEKMKTAGFDGRTSAIAYACARMYRRLNLWDAIAPHAEPIKDILVTDGDLASPSRRGGVAGGFLHFDSRELGADEPLGWIIENRLLRNAIFEAIDAHPNIELIAPAACEKTTPGHSGASLELRDGRTNKARLVVAADGKRSRLAAAAGIRAFNWGYGQSGLVATVAHERPHNGVAQEYFLPSGPFAILPMTDNRSSLVWTEKTAAAEAYIASDTEVFLEAIKTRFGDYLGAVHLSGPRWCYPLGLSFSHKFYGPRLALVGDAARAIHPIAGQGYNLGLKDIAALVDVLSEARRVGLDIGDEGVLARYDQWRRFDSAALALGTDVLNRFFSNDFGPAKHLRRFGLGLLNRVQPLKIAFMKESGADLGRLPSLLQAQG